MTLAVSTTDLEVRYGETIAVHPTTLKIETGEIHVLLGQSGSGKTTLLRSIAGFERASSGSIGISGKCVDDASRTYVAPERRRVGLVFQDYALFPHLSVAENVGFGVGAKDVEDWLGRVGLSGYEQRSPASLSGGEQQRVALARALACNPELVLLDEPFSNLDRGLRHALRKTTIDVLRQAGAAAIFVTHDAPEALGLADQISVLHAGHVLQTGAPRAVYQTPSSRQVALSVGEANFLPAQGNRCPLGEFVVRAGSAGGSTVVIRPEEISISDRGTPAKVLHATYTGAHVLLTCQLAGHEVLVLSHTEPTEDEVKLTLSCPVATVES